MKSLRLLQWSGSVLSPRTRPCPLRYQCLYRRRLAPSLRLQSTAIARIEEETDRDDASPTSDPNHDNSTLASTDPPATRHTNPLLDLPSPPPNLALKSAKLSALHARLSLSPRLPLQTLGRCLIDPTAEINPNYNNYSLSILGTDLLGYYTSEVLLCRHPRLPMEVIVAAMQAYSGPKTLAAITKEWGVEYAAAPGGEVDPGLLQFIRAEVDDAHFSSQSMGHPPFRAQPWSRGASSRTVAETLSPTPQRSELDYAERPSLRAQEALERAAQGTPLETASCNFVRALMGAIYLHTGLRGTKNFFRAHVLSRHLDISSLFEFRQPTRDLSRLCAREGFEPPVARILSETGRKSRHPVFVVGVFSGRDCLGEGSGGSLDEARFRAAVGALKGWYLYSPPKVRVPSEAGEGGTWEGVLVDGGEVIV